MRDRALAACLENGLIAMASGVRPVRNPGFTSQSAIANPTSTNTKRTMMPSPPEPVRFLDCSELSDTRIFLTCEGAVVSWRSFAKEGEGARIPPRFFIALAGRFAASPYFLVPA